MLSKKSIICLLLPLFVGTGVDQLTKYMVRQSLTSDMSMSYLAGTLQLQFVENRGGFLGYLNSIPETPRIFLLTFGVGSLLIAGAFFLLFYHGLTTLDRIVGAAILAGGTGNLLDRLLHNGGVIDFMSIGLGSFRTGIFNVADILILAGAFYLGCKYAYRFG